MGATNAKNKNAKKKYEKRSRQLDQLAAELAARLDEIVTDAHRRLERELAEVASVREATQRDAEHAHAQLREIVDAADARAQEHLARLEGVQATIDDHGFERRVAERTALLDDLTTDAQERARAHAADLAELSASARAATDDALARLRDAVAEAEHVARSVAEQADGHRQAIQDAWARTLAAISDLDARIQQTADPTTSAPPEPPAPEPAPPEPQADDSPSDHLRWTPAAEPPRHEPTLDEPTPDETTLHETTPDEPTPHERPAPPSDAATAPAAVATVVAHPITTTSTRATNPVTFHASRADLVASLTQLRRTAADGWVRVEPVHRASQGQAVASLRLTVQDVVGGCEHHDVPGRASSGSRRAVTVDAEELRHAVEYDQSTGDTMSLELDGDITIGTVLVPGRNTTVPILVGERRKVERIRLPRAGADGLALDTLAGRFVLPSRVVSSLRSRRAHDVDLVMVGEEPCLSAPVPGPTTEIAATVEIALRDAAVRHEDAQERRDAAANPVSQLVSALSTGSSPEELLEVVAHGVGYARRRAAAHPALPEGAITAIVCDGTEAMRAAAAANPSIPAAAIERAAGDEAPAVRAAVAANPRVPPALLFQLLRDDSAQVRVRVAHNPALPPEMLTLLAGDDDATVRAAVAAHESCPIETLVELSGDTFPGVCARVARNPRCPVEVLEQLLSIVPDVVLSNPRAPEHVLVAGSKVGAAALRAAVAANPSTPTRELQTLARDPDRNVVLALATNPNASGSLRRRARRRSERARAAKASSDVA